MPPLAWLLLPVASGAPPAPAPARFDLKLQDADVHAAILLLADAGDLDVVVPDTVSGTVTLHLVDVTWDTAFAALLANEGLAAVAAGDTVSIAPIGAALP
jgi:type IV pilus assembly protein PilQ